MQNRLKRATRLLVLGLAAGIVAILGMAALRAAAPRGLPKVKEIDGDRVHTVLPPDAIRAIDRPKFVPADKARFMRDEEPVVGVHHNGVAKAYSLWHLDHHEIVNDTFGDDPLAVTW